MASADLRPCFQLLADSARDPRVCVAPYSSRRHPAAAIRHRRATTGRSASGARALSEPPPSAFEGHFCETDQAVASGVMVRLRS